ncbi:DUF1990 family protein [Streptomyces chrestomyceticus]|uniref:DUF1990 family protein n=1 Tax=Streptomyces chrestomyceticus TaxID=68185 RepID=UPI0019D01ABD|nr:DUF1990 domain-containing protein [Streptomyces chrestomyceticus]
MTTGSTAAPSPFNYAEEGATRRRPLPGGYRHLHEATYLGHGRAVLEAAGHAVTSFRMHRAAGVRVRASAPEAAPGVRVECALGLGPARLWAPCRVVWSEYESERIGFAYGTLAGHPQRGEESFVVEMREDGAVWFTMTAFSVPGRWYTRLAGPLVPVFQRLYARHCGRTLRRLARRDR